jgi:large subunit ribosomal protein L19
VSQELMNKVAEKVLKKQVPAFQVGDTVNVSNKIVEGDKERVQVFRGTVIARRGRGVGQTFIVRRIVNNEGVERTFPLHSPMLVGVEVVRAGRTRRAKLYYLRQRIGKATRLRDILVEGEAQPAAHAAQAQGQPASKE